MGHIIDKRSTWNIWDGRTENTLKQQIIEVFEKLLSENDFEAVLATFCCYEHGVSSAEADQKITTDQQDYQQCSSFVIVFWIAKIYQLITVLLTVT